MTMAVKRFLAVAAAVLVAAGIACAAAPRAPETLSVVLLSPVREAMPRQSLTLMWEVTNHGAAAVGLDAVAEVPPKWGVLLPPAPVVLGPGEGAMRTMSVHVAPDVPPRGGGVSIC